MLKNLEKIINKYWIQIIIVFAFFILFGSVTVKFNIENFENDCPDTQNCSKDGVVHECNITAMSIEENQFRNKINKLNSELTNLSDENKELDTSISTTENELIKQKETATDWQRNYDQLNANYQNINQKLNQSKELLKKEQEISNSNLYLQIPNFECKDCPALKNMEASLEQCQQECNETDSCDLINYYAPKKSCTLVKNMDYNKMGYSSYDMYLKTNRNKTGEFNINEILKSKAASAASALSDSASSASARRAAAEAKAAAEKAAAEAKARRKVALRNEITSLRRKIVENIMNPYLANKYRKELEQVQAEYNKL